MKKLVLCLSVLGFIILCVWAAIAGVAFKTNCGDYIKLAADAPTIERADVFLGKAIAYLDEKKLNEGNTGIFFHYPTNDVGIWRLQLAKAKTILVEVLGREKKGETISELERTNILMKVRETLVDTGKEGIRITHPVNISLFPNQIIFWVMFSIFLLLMGGMFLWFLIENDKLKKKKVKRP